jgi:hypothetical protein
MLLTPKTFKIFLSVILSVFFLLIGLYLGYAYGKMETGKIATARLNECSQKADNVKLETFLDVALNKSNKNTFIITYKNNNDCFDFNKINSQIKVYNNNEIDTITLTLKETLYAHKKITLDITDLPCDSIKLLNSVIINKSINF